MSEYLPNVLQSRSESLKKLEDSNHRTFLKRLVNYFKPSSNRFSRFELGNKKQTQMYTLAGLELIDCLLEVEEVSSASQRALSSKYSLYDRNTFSCVCVYVCVDWSVKFHFCGSRMNYFFPLPNQSCCHLHTPHVAKSVCTVKVKLSHYRPGQALRALGG